jgi:hypothetical protein
VQICPQSSKVWLTADRGYVAGALGFGRFVSLEEDKSLAV